MYNIPVNVLPSHSENAGKNTEHMQFVPLTTWWRQHIPWQQLADWNDGPTTKHEAETARVTPALPHVVTAAGSANIQRIEGTRL